MTIKKLTVLFISLLALAALAAPAFALPPRPDPAAPASAPKLPNGAIELIVDGATPGLWTVVQWQDGTGDWHDVPGWQGALDATHQKTWWVDSADYGKGPFRWVVGQGDETLAASESFDLPAARGQVVRVFISLLP